MIINCSHLSGILVAGLTLVLRALFLHQVAVSEGVADIVLDKVLLSTLGSRTVVSVPSPVETLGHQVTVLPALVSTLDVVSLPQLGLGHLAHLSTLQ